MNKHGDMKKIDITIYAEFGSKFQEELATTALDRMVKAWMTFYMTTHKKNKIKVEFQLEERKPFGGTLDIKRMRKMWNDALKDEVKPKKKKVPCKGCKGNGCLHPEEHHNPKDKYDEYCGIKNRCPKCKGKGLVPCKG